MFQKIQICTNILRIFVNNHEEFNDRDGGVFGPAKLLYQGKMWIYFFIIKIILNGKCKKVKYRQCVKYIDERYTTH